MNPARLLRRVASPLAIVALLAGSAVAQETPLPERLDALEAGLAEVEARSLAGEDGAARARITRLYLDEYEPIEGWWGPNGPLAAEPLSTRVAEAETAFHDLMAADPDEVPARVETVRRRLAAVRAATATTDTPLEPGTAIATAATVSGAAGIDPDRARTPEIHAVLQEIALAHEAWRAGDRAAAMARVEHAYLEGLEPLEPRLPAGPVAEAERAIHLGLRPGLARDAPPEDVAAAFEAVEASLLALDESLGAESSFWFTAVSAFAIILREGLEAVLLVGAILAYLSRVSDDRRHRRQVWGGVIAGVLASVGTWVVARTLIPIGGASRELIEGVTALLAVGVLVYVSHWLFQKTYIHDWKEYLQDRVGTAVTTGSTLAMAGLAFAAVYREGFETVLFYQALLFDAGAGAVAAGFVPGLLLILAVGAGILKVGLKLPLKKVFGITNAILLYLAFVFLGKGLYNLQEAGLFTPRPVSWIPDHEALRQLLGLYPIVETLAAQLVFLFALGTAWTLYRGRAKGRARRPAEVRDAEAGAGSGRPLKEESAAAS